MPVHVCMCGLVSTSKPRPSILPSILPPILPSILPPILPSILAQGLPTEIQTDGGVFVGNIVTREALVDDKVFIQTAEAFGEACRRKKVAIS